MRVTAGKIYDYRTITKIIAKGILENSYKYIGVTGTSCVGKSTFTKLIRKQLEKTGYTVRVVMMDDYLLERFRAGTQFWNRSESTYLKPEYFDWSRCKENIDKLKLGESVTIEGYIRGIGWGNSITLEPADFIIVDGLFLDSMQAADYMEYDYLISLTATDEFITELRLARDEYYRQNYKNFNRTVEETKKEIENTLLAGKSYKICFDKWKSMRLRVSERFKAVPQKQRQRVC